MKCAPWKTELACKRLGRPSRRIVRLDAPGTDDKKAGSAKYGTDHLLIELQGLHWKQVKSPVSIVIQSLDVQDYLQRLFDDF